MSGQEPPGAEMGMDGHQGRFPETRWSCVLAMRDGQGDGERGTRALAELCEAYWAPLFSFAQRCGYSREDAEDLTQGYFTRVLSAELFRKADPAVGRLRSFLLGGFKNYMSEQSRFGNRQKRGGGVSVLSLDDAGLGSENGTVAPQARGITPPPDEEFDREWFLAVLEHALADLEREYESRGRLATFHHLREHLAWNQRDGRLGHVAAALGMSPGAVRVAIVRMRQRYRELVEARIADTVPSPGAAAEELEHLKALLGR